MKGFCDTYTPKGSYEHAEVLFYSCRLFNKLDMHETQLNCARQALKIYEDTGDELSAEATMTQVTNSLSSLGRHREAIALQEEFLEKMIKKYGLEHNHTAATRYNL